MRTTIRLEPILLRRAKARAAASGQSLNDFIADAVRAALSPQRTAAARVQLPTFKGGVLLPGIDLDDTSSLLDLIGEDYAYARANESPASARVAESPAAPHPRTGGGKSRR